MANLTGGNGDAGATERIDPRLPQPATHGQIRVRTMNIKHAREHMRQHMAHANTTKDYGGHGIGYSSQGAFASGGGGTDYQTTNVGGTGDADSMT